MRKPTVSIVLAACVVLAGCAQIESLPLQDGLKVRADHLVPKEDRSTSTINIWVHKIDPKSADVIDAQLLDAGYTWYGKIAIETAGEQWYVNHYKWNGDTSNWYAVEDPVTLERTQAVFQGLQPTDSVKPRPDEILPSLEATR